MNLPSLWFARRLSSLTTLGGAFGDKLVEHVEDDDESGELILFVLYAALLLLLFGIVNSFMSKLLFKVKTGWFNAWDLICCGSNSFEDDVCMRK